MRVAVAYPPLLRGGKIPLLGQNRQFKYTHSKEIKIFPLVPAHAATSLKAAGHEVLWLDGINKGITGEEFGMTIEREKPDLIIIETKTPIIQKHWEYINNLKSKIQNLKCVLVGDHVSFFPEESMRNSSVDFVITGGDFDVSLLKLCEHLSGRGPSVYKRTACRDMPLRMFSSQSDPCL